MDLSNCNQAAQDLKTLLGKESALFLEGQREALVTFTEDELKSIFEDAVFERIAIPDLPPDASADAIASREEICLRKDLASQLFAAAKLKHAELSSALKAKAITAVAKVLSSAAALGFTVVKAGLGA